MAVSVQSGRASVGGTASTIDVTISAVDTSNTWIKRTTVLGGNSSPARQDFTAELINSTTIRFTRGLANIAGEISWFAISDSNATVQRGTVSFSTSEDNKTATISSVDLTKSFIAITVRTDSGTNANLSYFTAVFENATTIRLRRQTTGASSVVSWEVVTISDAVVQAGFREFSGATQATESITAVDLATTFVIAHHSGASNIHGRNLVATDFSASNTLRFRKGVATSAVAVGWFVVSCPRYSVQLADSGYVTTQTVNNTISSVDLTRSWLTTTARSANTSTGSQTPHYSVYYTNATTVTRERSTTTSNLQSLTFAIEMEEGGDPVIEATLAAQEVGNDVVDITATVAVNGVLSSTEASNDTVNISANVTNVATLTALEHEEDTVEIDLSLSNIVTLSALEVGQDTFSGTLEASNFAELNIQEENNDVFSASSTVNVSGVLNSVEIGSDTVNIGVQVEETDPVITAQLNSQEIGLDIVSISADVSILAELNATESTQDLTSIALSVLGNQDSWNIRTMSKLILDGNTQTTGSWFPLGINTGVRKPESIMIAVFGDLGGGTITFDGALVTPEGAPIAASAAALKRKVNLETLSISAVGYYIVEVAELPTIRAVLAGSTEPTVQVYIV